MSAVRVSVLFSAADRYVSQILLIATTAVMARLLTPAETGIYLLANTVIMLADNFRTFGTGVYIVQATDLRNETVRSAFTVTLILSLAMGLAIFLAASSIALFYDQPELASLLHIAVLGFVAIPFGTPLVAMLQRELAFSKLAVVNIAAATANAAVTIGLGIAGVGPSSYLWGFVAFSVTLALTAFALRPQAWVFRPSLAEFGRVISFGTVSSAVSVANMASEMLPRLIFGRVLGFDALALYGRAMTICQLPDRALVQALQPVVLPAMAAYMREGGDIKQAYLRGHAMMSVFQWPALAMLALLADPVVRILLGAQWTETVPLVRVIALATMALAPAFMTFPVLVVTGHIRDTLLSTLVALPPSVVILGYAATISLDAVAVGMLVCVPLQMAVALFFVRRAIGIGVRDMLEASRASLAITAGTLCSPAAIVLLSPEGLALSLPHAVLAILAGGLGWLATVRFYDHPVGAEMGEISRLLHGRKWGRNIRVAVPPE